ncbi:hypothetical protein M3J09_009117 [Ascochyta lentis]
MLLASLSCLFSVSHLLLFPLPLPFSRTPLHLHRGAIISGAILRTCDKGVNLSLAWQLQPPSVTSHPLTCVKNTPLSSQQLHMLQTHKCCAHLSNPFFFFPSCHCLPSSMTPSSLAAMPLPRKNCITN